MNKITARSFVHPWHDLSVGQDAPHTVNSIIEIVQGSKAKYELDKENGYLRLDRILSTHLTYPFHYGFIPQTYCDDKDPLDILIICSEPLFPLTIVEATVLGSMSMIDGGEQDDKIIAVASNDPLMKQKNTLSDLNPELLNTISYFFANYKAAENKVVHVEGFLERDHAHTIVEQAIALYNRTFK